MPERVFHLYFFPIGDVRYLEDDDFQTIELPTAMHPGMNRLDRVEGALLGTALGDALGLPREGLSRRPAERLRLGDLGCVPAGSPCIGTRPITWNYDIPLSV